MKKLISGILAISLLTSGISCFAEANQAKEESATTTNCATSNQKVEKSSKVNTGLKVVTIVASTTAGTIAGWLGNDLVKYLKSRELNKLKAQEKNELNNQSQVEEDTNEEENYNN